MGFLGLVAVSVLLTQDPAAARTRVVLVMATAGAVIVLGAAVFAADAATRRTRRPTVLPAAQPAIQAPAQPAVARGYEDLQRRLNGLVFLVGRGRQDLQGLTERVKTGETLAPRSADHPPADTNDPFMQLAHELQKAQNEAWNAVLEAVSQRPDAISDRRVEVFVNLARRMQSLSHRAIQGLDELENQVEDPDLLKGLFKVDHLSTRIRRQAESLAVIGGASSRRQWSRPVTVYEVLRSAIAEVEHYNRVKVVPPVEGTLDGSAVADVIHLLAELVENATKFAPPHTQVLLRVENVTAGLAIEVEDRGLGIPRDSQHRLNDLLSNLDRINIDELLQDGRIGLLVVSALARRHNVGVRLQTNLYGGTQAIVVVPNELIGTESEDGQTPMASPAAAPEPVPAMAASAPAPMPAPLPGRHAQPADNGRMAEPPAAAWDNLPPATPVRQSEPQADTWSAPPPPAADPAPPSRPNAGERPQLPKRHAQTNLAPELRRAPVSESDDPGTEHNPGLMAAFQRGVRSGQDDDGLADFTDSTS